MRYKIMKAVDVSYLDDILLNDDGFVRPIPAAQIADISHDHIMQWCVINAIYQILTMELIDWLRDKIAGRSVIEICSGKSGIGHTLGIPCTDSYQQVKMKEYFQMLKQTPIVPPAYVEELESIDAVDKYKPEVVVGAFVTQKWFPGDEEGNQFGPHESLLLEKVSTYIHVGNELTHHHKRILKINHESHQFPWLRSRAVEQDKNVIWVWNKETK